MEMYGPGIGSALLGAVRRPGDEGRRLASAHQRLVDQLGNRLRGALPGVALDVGQPEGAQVFAQAGVLQHVAHAAGDVLDVQWLEIQDAFAEHFGNRRRPRRDYRAATGLRLQRRYAEAFVERRKDERG